MQNEIINLLKREGKLSDEAIDEISNFDIHDFSNVVKTLGGEETEHIKRDEITSDLNTKYIGKNLYVFKEVYSTNTVAKFLASNDVENGTVVISEKQTGAKGRSGKSWESPLGGVWLSIILRPNVDHSKLPLITLATGVAVARTLEKLGIDSGEIKWPNDIYMNDKKVCGILTEAITTFNTIESVIVGVGIDVNIDMNNFPDELKEGTTTLQNETGLEIDENLLIKTFLEEFEVIGELFTNGEYETILKEWRKRSYSIGKIVEVRQAFSKPFDAYVLGVSREGALVVEKIDGTLEKVISGECIIKN